MPLARWLAEMYPISHFYFFPICCILLFVTLDKKDFDGEIQYEDIFDDEGQTFFWESQNRSTQKTNVIQRIINGDSVLLFCIIGVSYFR